MERESDDKWFADLPKISAHAKIKNEIYNEHKQKILENKNRVKDTIREQKDLAKKNKKEVVSKEYAKKGCRNISR